VRELSSHCRPSKSRHAFAFSRLNSPELCLFLHPLKTKRAQGRPGASSHPRSAARKMHTQKEPHSSIQVWPITRPSLRGGRTPYAVLSREPNFPSGLPRPANWMMQSARLGSLAPSQKLDRSNDGQDHTVLPYAHSLAPQGRRHRARSHRMLARRTEQRRSSARGVRAHRDYPPCPPHLVPTLPRPPQARLAIKTTSRSPLLDEPGWPTHTQKPNFGKVEYFRAMGLTGCDTGHLARSAIP